MNRRAITAAVVASAVAAGAIALMTAGGEPGPPRDPAGRPNVVIVLTDDQPFDSISHAPAAMPYLQRQWGRRAAGWIRFPNAFVNTPLCCPSRASILTGRYSHHTGVRDNDDGARFDDSTTLATWLHDAGYTTGLVGKYLNRYPFGAGEPFVPPGWDTWVAKTNQSADTVYANYLLARGDRFERYGEAEDEYATDVLGREAARFVREAPEGRPFFLLFAPSAPHEPWIPAARHEGALAAFRIAEPASVAEADVSDKPGWVRRLPLPTTEQREAWIEERRRALETLLAVDDAIREIDLALRDRGVMEDTVVFFLSDNGYAWGEHRWQSKSCPYAACVRVPFAVRVPAERSRVDPSLVSNVDLAPTIAALARATPGVPFDGLDVSPALLDAVEIRRRGVLAEWVGGFAGPDGPIPGWWSVRTAGAVYTEYATGERELYDVGGIRGPADPNELDNRVDDPAYARLRARLAGLLDRLRG